MAFSIVNRLLKEHFTGPCISDSALGAKRFWSHIKLGSLALSQSKLDSGSVMLRLENKNVRGGFPNNIQ